MKNYGMLTRLFAVLLFLPALCHAKPAHTHTSTASHGRIRQHSRSRIAHVRAHRGAEFIAIDFGPTYSLDQEWVNRKGTAGLLTWVLKGGSSRVAVTSFKAQKLQDYVSHMPSSSSITIYVCSPDSYPSAADMEVIKKLCKSRGIGLEGEII